MTDRARELDARARALDWEIAPDCFGDALGILRDPDCSLATASYLFWAAQPQDFSSRVLDESVEGEGVPTQWMVVREAVLGTQEGRFSKAIAYDPASEWDLEVAPPPSFLHEPTQGAEPVVWREASEIERMWDDELEREIASAADAEDLYNIATFLDTPETLALVLDSPVLDVGTALLTYWRLRRAARLWTDAAPLMKRAASLVASQTLPAVVAYAPAADPNNEELIRPARWAVPDVLRRPTLAAE